MDFLTRVNPIVLNVLINALLVIKTVHIVLHVAMHQEIVALANVCKYLIYHLLFILISCNNGYWESEDS